MRLGGGTGCQFFSKISVYQHRTCTKNKCARELILSDSIILQGQNGTGARDEAEQDRAHGKVALPTMSFLKASHRYSF